MIRTRMHLPRPADEAARARCACWSAQHRLEPARATHRQAERQLLQHNHQKRCHTLLALTTDQPNSPFHYYHTAPALQPILKNINIVACPDRVYC